MLSKSHQRREALSALRPHKLSVETIDNPLILFNKDEDFDWHSPMHICLDSPHPVESQLEELEPTLWSSNVGPSEFLYDKQPDKHFFDPVTKRWYESERHCIEWPYNLRTKSASARSFLWENRKRASAKTYARKLVKKSKAQRLKACRKSHTIKKLDEGVIYEVAQKAGL